MTESNSNKRVSKTFKTHFVPDNKYKDEKYLRQTLNHMTCFNKIQAKCVWLAFKSTVEYMFEHGIEFKINDFVSFVQQDVKEKVCSCPVTPSGTIVMPAHKKMVFKTTKGLRDYLNARGRFEGIDKLTKLPDYDKDKNKSNKNS